MICYVTFKPQCPAENLFSVLDARTKFLRYCFVPSFTAIVIGSSTLSAHAKRRCLFGQSPLSDVSVFQKDYKTFKQATAES